MDQVQPCTLVRVTIPYYVIKNTMNCYSLEVLHKRKFEFLLISAFVFQVLLSLHTRLRLNFDRYLPLYFKNLSSFLKTRGSIKRFNNIQNYFINMSYLFPSIIFVIHKLYLF